MKLQSLIPWVLGGGLLASTFFNVHLISRLDDAEARLQGQPAPEAPLPTRVVTELGLTAKQCADIQDCSLN